MTEQVFTLVGRFIGMPIVQAACILAGAFFAALITRLIFTRLIYVAGRKTKSVIDDQLLLLLRTPVVYSIFLAGIAWAILLLDMNATARFVSLGIIKTVAVFFWGSAAMRGCGILLGVLSHQADRFTWIQPKTLPLFDIVLKVVVVGGSLYFAFIAWNINLTSWIASAGIVGIAVGFAAKDTLANLFAGVFILADSPYRIGDFIILDNGIRGIVTDIGVRSTRLLTRDDVEVTVPNAVIANAKIVNETGGPYQKMRVRVRVSVAYGSDVDRVRNTLLSCATGVEHICQNPEPRVRFREFGDSGLLFELLVWIEKPVYRGRVLDRLNTNVYTTFNEAGIEIPYAKQDLYIKEMPGR